jgi:hypothetical protein
VGGIYVFMQNPQLLEEIGTGGSAAPSTRDSAETIRLRTISALLISDANKQDLREGRIFWGAAPGMIDLAYGRAPESLSVRSHNGHTATFLRYRLDDERLWIAELQDEALACLHQSESQVTVCAPDGHSIYPAYPFD